jgi:hypothetical protein
MLRSHLVVCGGGAYVLLHEVWGKGASCSFLYGPGLGENDRLHPHTAPLSIDSDKRNHRPPRNACSAEHTLHQHIVEGERQLSTTGIPSAWNSSSYQTCSGSVPSRAFCRVLHPPAQRVLVDVDEFTCSGRRSVCVDHCALRGMDGWSQRKSAPWPADSS